MYKKLKLFVFTVSAVLVVTFSNAQDKVIQGIVTTFDSIPVIGAQVKISSSKQTVQTDTLGRFTAQVEDNDKLKVSAEGFFKQKVKLTDKVKFVAVNIKLKPGEKNREIAIGYGHVTDRNKLNALSSLNNDDVDFSQYSTIYELIKGRFAGVQVSNGEIIIRGINSINSSSAALIVVDGVPTNESVLNSIPPSQVKSIDVIKDGSSAIYGSRGANGVVLIETKRGGDQ